MSSPSSATPETFQSLSREVALACDPAGHVRWADARAHALLKAEEGKALRAIAAAGTEDKVDALFARAARGERVERWELVLCVDGAPRTFAFGAQQTSDDSVALVGSLVSEDYAGALEQVSENLSELAALHRETDRQGRELKTRAEELARANRDLAESHRGMRTLHAQLDERAETLQRAAELKGRLVAGVSHEFRTPLHSILGLARLLLNPLNGGLQPEQEKQVQFIRGSAEALYELVNDMLDLSKLESGKAALHAQRFELTELFVSLRGMMRPLLPLGSPLELRVEEPPQLALEQDEGKVAQVLRNLVSNAIKFTPRGHVRVWAEPLEGAGKLALHVEDTGIGIADEHLERVFEEFTQIDSPLQKGVKGTGLGLPLARGLAERLGGTLSVRSTPGQGSTFTLTLPLVHPEVAAMQSMVERSQTLDPERAPVLVLEDDRQTLFLYEKYLERAGFQVLPARTVAEARALVERVRPSAMVLDVMLEGEVSWGFLAEMKTQAHTRDIPLLVVTVTDREHKARALGADEFWLKPLDEDRLLKKLGQLARRGPFERVLVVDDDPVHRYLFRQFLAGTPYQLVEADSAEEAVRRARADRPGLILLDFVLGERTAFDVIDELKADPSTRDIPIILHTSRELEAEERARLEKETATILAKQTLSREVAIARIRDALEKAGLGAQEVKGEVGSGGAR